MQRVPNASLDSSDHVIGISGTDSLENLEEHTVFYDSLSHEISTTVSYEDVERETTRCGCPSREIFLTDNHENLKEKVACCVSPSLQTSANSSHENLEGHTAHFEPPSYEQSIRATASCGQTTRVNDHLEDHITYVYPPPYGESVPSTPANDDLVQLNTDSNFVETITLERLFDDRGVLEYGSELPEFQNSVERDSVTGNNSEVGDSFASTPSTSASSFDTDVTYENQFEQELRGRVDSTDIIRTEIRSERDAHINRQFGDNDSSVPRTSSSRYRSHHEQESQESFDFLKFFINLSSLVTSKDARVFLLSVVTYPPFIFCLVIGAFHIEDCRYESKIPVFLIVTGAGGIVIITVLFYLLNKPRDIYKQEGCWCSMVFWWILLLHGFVLCGSIYKLYRSSSRDPTSPNYCDETLVLFAFWTMNVIVMVTIFQVVFVLLWCKYKMRYSTLLTRFENNAEFL